MSNRVWVVGGVEVCGWESDPDFGTWATDCGQEFWIEDGTPGENEMKFCCYCGRPLRERGAVSA